MRTPPGIKQFTKRFAMALALMPVLAVPCLKAAQSKDNPVNTGADAIRSEAAAANAMSDKIEFLRQNSLRERPGQRPTIFHQDEINAYFAQRRVKIPEGVQRVLFDLTTGTVTAHARVDFDEITKECRLRNPLLAVFTGVHDVAVVAQASGSGGIAHVRVDSAAIDGMKIPRIALQLFVERFVTPKFPSIQLNGNYPLPVRIDTVTIGEHTGEVIQK